MVTCYKLTANHAEWAGELLGEALDRCKRGRVMDEATAEERIRDEQFRRELLAMTFPEVWAIVTRAWLARKRYPPQWGLITSTVDWVASMQARREGKEGA